MNTYKKRFVAKPQELTSTPVRVQYVEQASATPVAENVIGECPECGSPLLGLEDRITCSRAQAGCIFTITVRDFEDVLNGSLSPFLVEVVTNTMSYQELLHDMGSYSERRFSTEYEGLMECNVGLDFWIVKDHSGSWTIGVALEQGFADDEA